MSWKYTHLTVIHHLYEWVYKKTEKCLLSVFIVIITSLKWCEDSFYPISSSRFYWDSDCHGRLAINLTGCAFEQRSNSTAEWVIGDDEVPGTYRLTYNGHARITHDDVISVTGVSSEFSVTAAARGRTGRQKRWARRELPRAGAVWEEEEAEEVWDEGMWDYMDEEEFVELVSKMVSHWWWGVVMLIFQLLYIAICYHLY